LKYFSYTDNLDLTIENITNFSPYELKAYLNKSNKKITQPLHILISGLEDPVLRSYHLTIEKNTWLKQLLLADFNTLKKNSIQFNSEHISYFYGFKRFLEPYLKPILPNLITFMITNNEHKMLFNILENIELFSDELKKDLVRYLKDKIDDGMRYLKGTPIIESHIKYLKSYHFYETLNLYESDFKNDLIRLYDAIIAIHDQFDKNSPEPTFRFVSQALVAFRKSQIDDVATKLFIDNNAENAKDYAYQNKTIETPVIQSNKESFTLKIGGIIALSFLILIIIIFNGNSNTKQETPTTNQVKSDNYSNKKKRTTYDNRIRFYYSLKRRTKIGKVDETLDEAALIPFSNPYPKTFNLIAHSSKPSSTKNTLINNNTDSGLILFRMVKGRDQSLFIPKNESVYIALKTSDSLLFYNGNNFVASKFSHFREDMAISEIYEVKKTPGSLNPKITLKTKELSIKSDSTSFIIPEHISTSNNVALRRISIDNLYRVYYSNYMN